MAVNFVLSVAGVWAFFKSPNFSKYLTYNIMGYDITFGLDSFSIYFILLTALLLPMCLILSHNYNKFQKSIVVVYGSILFLLNVVFTIQDLLGFYISFESIVIPMFILIGV